MDISVKEMDWEGCKFGEEAFVVCQAMVMLIFAIGLAAQHSLHNI